MIRDLFDNNDGRVWAEQLSSGTFLLHHLASKDSPLLLDSINTVLQQAPLRHMVTPGGLRMSVAMSNCGDVGWVSDHSVYRYSRIDPQSGKHWPVMPAILRELAENAANEAGYVNFHPDACLINRYAPESKLSLHQDKDEQDFSAPIVSVSLGLPAIFLLGGSNRRDKTQHLALYHGDVLVWGGADRLRFHGVLPLADGQHELVGDCRINLTFRQALV